MDFFNFDFENTHSFEITPLIKEFENCEFGDLFPNHQIIENEMGSFIDISWNEDIKPFASRLINTKRRLLKNLKTIYYIGESTERDFKKRGVTNLKDLLIHKRFGNSARKILLLIRKKNYQKLCKNRDIRDIDVSFCFKPEDYLFLDIETLGLYDSPMIIVGLGFFKQNQFEIHAFFADDLEDEIAICSHLINQVLPRFKCFITYNGKSFDIPYIANRFLYYFDSNPMISEQDIPYEVSNTLYHHIDLYHNCRRKFKGEFPNYQLGTIEEQLINFKRENELPSNLVGLCYQKYQKNRKRYIGLIKECIEHNYYDIYSMPLIFKKLL